MTTAGEAAPANSPSLKSPRVSLGDKVRTWMDERTHSSPVSLRRALASDDWLTAPSLATVGVGIRQSEADAMYGLSQPAESIDRFISHSWSAPRLAKWWALCDMLHRHFAVVTALVIASAFSLSSLAYRFCSGAPIPYHAATDVLVPYVVLSGCLAMGPPSRGCSCFLDKLCVHQTDEDLKRRAIQCVDQAIIRSKRLTILWSNDDFERLWCIFEVATFVSTHGDKDALKGSVEVLPLWLPPSLSRLFLCNIVIAMCSATIMASPFFATLCSKAGPNVGIGFFWVFSCTLPAAYMCRLLRSKAEAATDAYSYLSTFRLDSTRVTVEGDRAIVYACITARFGSPESFEAFVRKDLLDSIRRRIGNPYSFPYQWVTFICLPFAFWAYVDALSTSAEGIVAQGYSCDAPFVRYVLYHVCVFFYGNQNPMIEMSAAAGRRGET
mmetsp:Transcript_897/g.2744  ORF Transcript_897/g.2744 Transcript_897/m.2744 type:complete len:439 (+) Transcript_897:185-1501(+)